MIFLKIKKKQFDTIDHCRIQSKFLKFVLSLTINFRFKLIRQNLSKSTQLGTYSNWKKLELDEIGKKYANFRFVVDLTKLCRIQQNQYQKLNATKFIFLSIFFSHQLVEVHHAEGLSCSIRTVYIWSTSGQHSFHIGWQN